MDIHTQSFVFLNLKKFENIYIFLIWKYLGDRMKGVLDSSCVLGVKTGVWTMKSDFPTENEV